MYLNSRPHQTLDVPADGARTIDLAAPPGGLNTLELRGFRNGQLVASTRLRV